jgi:hypothetical protein
MSGNKFDDALSISQRRLHWTSSGSRKRNGRDFSRPGAAADAEVHEAMRLVDSMTGAAIRVRASTSITNDYRPA